MRVTNLALIAVLSVSGIARADSSKQLDALLGDIRKGQTQSREVNRDREQRFLSDKREQEKLLRDARGEVGGLEKRADRLRATFAANEKAIKEQREALTKKSGDLEQLKAVIRQASADTHSKLVESLVTAQFPERLEVLADLSTTERLPSSQDIESLWYELQREMIENGRVAKFKAEVFDSSGKTRSATVERIGLFALRADEQYLEYRSEDRRLEVLQQQPDLGGRGGGFLGGPGEEFVLLDPTRGLLFGLLVERPGLRERVHQGGLVGYLILGLGAFGLVLVAVQMSYLIRVGGRIHRQLKNISAPNDDNPLGRILQVGTRMTDSSDLESIELQVDEAILKETPKLERLQGTIKLLAAVAPLMGLLGTVTGMIATFQAITLFGTGDAKLMAGGISQALVTTVLGLVVAIPMLFLHSLMASRSRGLIQILDEQSAGLIGRAQEARSNVGSGGDV